MRVAAIQFEVSDDIDANLVTCLRMIGRAREECDPDLIVLPEYCNHPPLYGDPEHCFEVAQPPEGKFLATIAREARKSACMIQVNVTTRHRNNAVRNTNTMFSSDGRKIGESNKQFLITGENLSGKAGSTLRHNRNRVRQYRYVFLHGRRVHGGDAQPRASRRSALVK